MINILQLIAIGLMAGVLASGYFFSSQPVFAVTTLLLGVVWGGVSWFGVSDAEKEKGQSLPPQKRHRGDPSIDNLALLVFVGLATWGVWQKLPPWLMLVVVILTLAAWDLGRFANRLLSVLDAETAVRLEQNHLTRLGAALLGGLILGSLMLLIHVQLDFGWALFLGIVGIFALNRFTKGIAR